MSPIFYVTFIPNLFRFVTIKKLTYSIDTCKLWKTVSWPLWHARYFFLYILSLTDDIHLFIWTFISWMNNYKILIALRKSHFTLNTQSAGSIFRWIHSPRLFGVVHDNLQRVRQMSRSSSARNPIALRLLISLPPFQTRSFLCLFPYFS